jgi:hypothetical protein
MLTSVMFFNERRHLVDLAAKPAAGSVPSEEFVDAGGLMAYGANIPDMFRRAGLRGQDSLGEAGDLPSSSPASSSW